MPSRPNSFVPSAREMQQAFAGAGASELVFLMRQCLERGAYDHALALHAALGPELAGDPALALCEAIARFVGGERDAALAAVAELAAQRPADLNVLSVLAEMRARSGDPRGACAVLETLIERYPDYPGAQPALASLLMPGPPYREILKAIHRALTPRTYLEIGVETGGTLALATSAELAVGVDPADFPLEAALPPGARVVRETSDTFFMTRTRESVFGERPVELAFIDGMHLFEFALRDFAHVERWCGPNSTIVLHDCVPLARVTAERERRTRFWVGDTWKAAFALARHRPDLRIRTILTPPSGLVVVRRLDPSSTTLLDHFAAIERELLPLAYPHGPGEWPTELGPVPNSLAGMNEALG
ncbi:MAG TPA: class I SAM-dependent methyltransferase [Polyangiaceae bacterium]|nr:class I SAM-dependent methyltransferase [Polyangiaceae bacterium]